MSTPPTPNPIEIKRAGEHDVQIRWDNGKIVVYPARFLRFFCPCAMCVDEATGRRTLREASLSENVHPVAIEPVGHYAIAIRFSDGHNSGIYTWEHLYDLANELP